MSGQNPSSIQTTPDDDDIQIVDEIPPKARITSSNALYRPRNDSSNITLPISQPQMPATTSHSYPRVHYNIARSSVAHGDVIDPLDFPDSPRENNSDDENDHLNPFIAARTFTVKHLKYHQDHPNPPYFPLSFHEKRLSQLLHVPDSSYYEVKAREKELQKSFEDDCATHGYFAQCYINKNPKLEEPLRKALNETLKDLEAKYMKELDIYTELFMAKSSK